MIACRLEKLLPPVWQNEAKQIYIDRDSFIFTTSYKEWNLNLFSFSQPIPLKTTITKKGIIATPILTHGIIEGPAQLIFTNKDESYIYYFFLKNHDQNPPSLIDYRSPKTVNIDSSLQHQSIQTQIDSHRNLVEFTSNNTFFNERMNNLGTTVKTERAIADQSITAYYVNPGTPISIPIKGIYDKALNSYIIEVGELKDKYNNTIANGTVVDFKYKNEGTQNLITVSTWQGRAKIKIKAKDLSSLTITATVNHIVSPTITIVP
jgi:hypothetical protein